MKHLKQRSYFTVNNNLLLCCENDMKSKIQGVQSLYCTWDHVGYDHGCHISQKTVVVLFSNEKTCSQTSCTSVYNQYQFLNKVDLS